MAKEEEGQCRRGGMKGAERSLEGYLKRNGRKDSEGDYALNVEVIGTVIMCVP